MFFQQVRPRSVKWGSVLCKMNFPLTIFFMKSRTKGKFTHFDKFGSVFSKKRKKWTEIVTKILNIEGKIDFIVFLNKLWKKSSNFYQISFSIKFLVEIFFLPKRKYNLIRKKIVFCQKFAAEGRKNQFYCLYEQILNKKGEKPQKISQEVKFTGKLTV